MSLVSGPHSRARREQLTSFPGKAVIVRGDTGPIELKSPLSRGEARHSRIADYFLVRRRTDTQVVDLVAFAPDGRDAFKIRVTYEVVVEDPVGIFNEYGVESDPLTAIAKRIEDLSAREAGKFSRTERLNAAGAVRNVLTSEDFDLISIAILSVEVELSDETQARNDDRADNEEKKRKLELGQEIAILEERHKQALELQRLELQQGHALKDLEFRKQRINQIAGDLGMALDPLALNSLAAAGVPSRQDLDVLRSQIRSERNEDVQRLAQLMVTLSDAHLLDDDRHNAIMRFFDDVVDSASGDHRTAPMLDKPSRAVLEAAADEPEVPEKEID